MRRDPPGYTRPYRQQHKPLTVTMTNEEYAKIVVAALLLGLKPTTYATRVLRAELEKTDVKS